MGYTHYWYRPTEIDQDKYMGIVADFMRMVEPLREAGVMLADGCGEGEAIITFEDVCFNGPENCGHPKNHELGLVWPSQVAGGVNGSGNAIDGSWFAGATVENRCCNGDCSYETFSFPRVDAERTADYEGNLYFECTKTNFRPYDLAVNVFLIIAKHHLGDRIRIKSDGEEPHWFDAKMLCGSYLGYGLEFALTDKDPKDKPEPPKPTTPAYTFTSTADLAKQIRQALKAKFPGVTLSVRSKSYSGGSSIDVSWTDGPTTEQVKETTNGSESVRYDQWGEILSGGNRYVFCNRHLSPEFEAKVRAHLLQEWGRDINPNGDYEDHRIFYQAAADIVGDMPKPAAKVSTQKPTKPTAKPTNVPTGPVMAKFAVTGAWTWLTFTSKPSDEVLATIKGDGWRFSKKRTAWYNLDGKTPPVCVTYSQTA